MVFGIKWFARIQKVVMIFGIGGCIVLLGAISYYALKLGQTGFVESWNATAATYGSIDYAGFLKAAGEEAGGAMPTTWNWFDTFGVMVAGSWLFAYSYCITFIAGEVKRPDKTIILSNLFAIIVPGAFMLWAAIALYGLVKFDFFSATQFVDNAGSDLGGAYTVPWSTNFLGILGMVTTNKIIMFISVLSFLAFDLWWVALSYLAFPRIIFAWGMDRMGPKWFTDINPRFASPVKNHVLCFVLGQIMIAVYVFWQNEAMQGLAVTALEIFSVFGVTAIAALLFPYVKRAKGHLGRVAVQDLEDRRHPGGHDRRDRRPRLPGHPGLLLLLPSRPGQAPRGLHHQHGYPHRRDVGRGHHLVFRLEAAQQERGRRRLDDLRGVAAGVICWYLEGVGASALAPSLAFGVCR